jgi:Flp pilus assembly protein TadD
MTCRAPEAIPTKSLPEKAKLMSRNASLSQGSLSACSFARRLLEAGRAREALSVLEQEAETGGDSAEVQFLMGRAAFRLCDYDRAHRALCRAVVLSPDEAETYRWLARVLVRRGDAPCAVRVMARVPRPRAKPASDRAELERRRRAGAPRQ